MAETQSGDDAEILENSNGQMGLTQTCFTVEGENTTAGSSLADESNAEYSGGGAKNLAVDSDYAEWEFTTEHTIPTGEFEAWVRFDIETTDVAQAKWQLLDSSGSVLADTGTSSYGVSGPEWRNVSSAWGSWSPGELPPDTYTLRFDIVDDSGGQANHYLDVVAPLDALTRITDGSDATAAYTFDNDNGGNSGYLDGPELYPNAFQIELAEETVSFNLSHADVTSTWNDTSNDQAISVSNDGGQTWTTTNNTDSASVDFEDAGRTAQVRFTLSRYGSRTTATPKTGYLGQTVYDYTLEVDGNNLAVIDELELSSNHFENLQTLTGYADFQYVVEHDRGPLSDLEVRCFQRGDETRDSPSGYSDPMSENREVAAQSYYNSIYVQGAKDDQGNRPSATAKDQDAIDEAGREISPGVLRDLTITTEVGAMFRARALLDKALSENDLVGSKTIGPTVVPPGFSYQVGFGEGEKLKTLEEVSLTLGPDSAESTHQFSLPYELAETISGLKRETSDLSDRV